MKNFVCVLVLLAATLVAHSADLPKVGERFVFEQAGRHVPVWYFQPKSAGANAPVVFVMHGVKRNAEDYLRDWAPYAEKRNFLLVVPEFSTAEFPGDEGYNYGNTVRADGSAVPRAEWSFSMIEPIFDAVRSRTGNLSERYFIFGHSAGAQFVQRFVFFVPTSRVAHAVAANAGWYMLPDPSLAFPYGLAGTPVSSADVRRALGESVTILLGTADIDPKHKMLRHTLEAEAQGPHRFARGQYYFAHARAAAAELKTPFGWSLATAPGVAHSDQGMTPFAVDCLFPETFSTKTPKSP
ncbi:MAG: hypothetical protein JWM35_1713 [Verrucomicrobia bacterium]|nr:hypothetical protein [Verrucomicrobiota bacterium]